MAGDGSGLTSKQKLWIVVGAAFGAGIITINILGAMGIIEPINIGSSSSEAVDSDESGEVACEDGRALIRGVTEGTTGNLSTLYSNAEDIYLEAKGANAPESIQSASERLRYVFGPENDGPRSGEIMLDAFDQFEQACDDLDL